MCDANADCTAFSYMKYSNQCRLEGSYFSGHIKPNWRSDLYRKRGAESEVAISDEAGLAVRDPRCDLLPCKTCIGRQGVCNGRTEERCAEAYHLGSVWCGSSQESEVGDYRSPMIGYHVIGSAISTESGSVDDCMGMCDANADCTAFSYMKYSNQCRLEGSYFSGHIKPNWRSDLYR